MNEKLSPKRFFEGTLSFFKSSLKKILIYFLIGFSLGYITMSLFYYFNYVIVKTEIKGGEITKFERPIIFQAFNPFYQGINPYHYYFVHDKLGK